MSERLAPQPDEWIDRSRLIKFTFEGREYTGYSGDTISTALWAQGVRVLGRSFKYHRPRGIFSLADHDCNAMMESEERTNIRADVTPIEEGMNLKAVNTIGGVDRDVARVMDSLSPFFPVGFYYKTFHSPKRLFPFYERRFRQMAGLGSITPAKPVTCSPKRYEFCDVAVIGSGPAGLSSAIAAAQYGLRVILIEQHPVPGGTLCYQTAGNPTGRKLRDQLLAEISKLSNLELLTSTLAVGHYSDNWIALIDTRRMTKLRARSVIIASGCYEQPAVFRNNDLPGVMLVSAAQRLVHNYAVKPFNEGLILTANAYGYQAALDLHNEGIKVVAILDLRQEGEGTDLRARAKQVGIPILMGSAIYEAIPGKGKRCIRGAVICQIDSNGIPSLDKSSHIQCDGIAMSVGWAAADGLLRQAQTRMSYSKRLEQYVPETLPRGILAAGRVNGVYCLQDQLEDGARAGRAAASECGVSVSASHKASASKNVPVSHPYPIMSHPRAKNFIDLDEDIQLKDIENAVQEGFDNIELLKRYSTFGMGPSQGKHANMNVSRILTHLKRESLATSSLTTARPFISPVPLHHLAGRSFSPYRQTALHCRHIEAGAKFMYAGNWLRPEYYEENGQERQRTIAAEVRTVRQQVGIIDVSTLGKLEIRGPDAVKFVERMYTGRFAKLESGMTRYALLCDESGVMVDDGVAARLGSDHFYVTTTTGGSDSVAREMGRWALMWGMEITIVNATSNYAAMNLAGPFSNVVLESLTDIKLDHQDFPYLGVREGEVAGVRARVMRVGFVGELGYEIHVPADSAVHVWDEIMNAGKGYKIRPFGVEAQRILRLEKGHIIIGQDSDGLTNPFEANMSWTVKMDKPFFIGQRSLRILRTKPQSRSLAGFTVAKGHTGPVPKECHLVIDKGEIAGRVTSVAFSAILGCIIGIAYVKPNQLELGTGIKIRTDDGTLVPATITKMPFYDAGNLRQRQNDALSEVS